MNEQEALAVINTWKEFRITSETLTREDEYTSVGRGESHALLDGNFTADDLEAIAWYMRTHQ
jgi:hypothetical protein